MTARLKRDVNIRSVSVLGERGYGVPFRMELTAFSVPALAYYPAVLYYYSPDHGVGRRKARPALCKLYCPEHIVPCLHAVSSFRIKKPYGITIGLYCAVLTWCDLFHPDFYRRLRNLNGSACVCRQAGFTAGGGSHPAPRLYTSIIAHRVIIVKLYYRYQLFSNHTTSMRFAL